MKFEKDIVEQIKLKAKGFRERVGGTLFAFPVEEDNPFSVYAIVMYEEGLYFVFPQATDVSEAAAGILSTLEALNKKGKALTYEKDVCFITHQAQMDGPDVRMRRLKKEHPPELMKEEYDYSKGSEETGHLLSARGTLKLIYLAMVDEKNPKATKAMNEYYKFLAMNRYGKTAKVIKQEVRKMGKEQANKWIEQTYARYVKSPYDVFNLFKDVQQE